MAETLMINVRDGFNLGMFCQNVAMFYQNQGFTVNVAMMSPTNAQICFEKDLGGINTILGLGNGLVIDRCFKKALEEAEKEVPDNDRREQFLDIYRKNLEDNSQLYRLIVGIGDAAKQEIKIEDCIVKYKRENRNLNFDLQSAKWINAEKIIENPSSVCSNFSDQFGSNSQMIEFDITPPIKERFFVVVKDGKKGLHKLENDNKLGHQCLPNF